MNISLPHDGTNGSGADAARPHSADSELHR